MCTLIDTTAHSAGLIRATISHPDHQETRLGNYNRLTLCHASCGMHMCQPKSHACFITPSHSSSSAILLSSIRQPPDNEPARKTIGLEKGSAGNPQLVSSVPARAPQARAEKMRTLASQSSNGRRPVIRTRTGGQLSTLPLHSITLRASTNSGLQSALLTKDALAGRIQTGERTLAH